MSDTYTCASCGETFTSDRSAVARALDITFRDEEALDG